MHRYFANNHEMENVNQLIENNRDDTAKKSVSFYIILYARHYMPRLVYFLPLWWCDEFQNLTGLLQEPRMMTWAKKVQIGEITGFP